MYKYVHVNLKGIAQHRAAEKDRAITWTDIDHVLRYHMTSLRRNVLGQNGNYLEVEKSPEIMHENTSSILQTSEQSECCFCACRLCNPLKFQNKPNNTPIAGLKIAPIIVYGFNFQRKQLDIKLPSLDRWEKHCGS